MITKKVFPDLHYTILTCQGTKSGCTVTKAVWVRPDGKAISTELEYTMNNRPMSSLTIDSNHYRTPYTCKISYAGGYATKVYPGWFETQLQFFIVERIRLGPIRIGSRLADRRDIYPEVLPKGTLSKIGSVFYL